MSLPHLADAVCSFPILEECTEVPFVIDAKRFTGLGLYFERKSLVSFQLKDTLINSLEHI